MDRSSGPRLILSICGDSCVGKGTLIDHIKADRHQCREKFGVVGQVGFFASRSQARKNHASGEIETSYRPRHEMFQSPSVDTIVFKWQYKDHNLLTMLADAFPNASHRAVVLWRDWEQHQELRNTTHETKADVRKQWLKQVVRRFDRNHDSFDGGLVNAVVVALVDSSNDRYEPLEWEKINESARRSLAN